MKTSYIALAAFLIASLLFASCAHVGGASPRGARETPMFPINASDEGQLRRGTDVGLPKAHELPENRGTSRGSN